MNMIKGLSQRQYESPYSPTWCPGCGNFAIWTALKKTLAHMGIPPHKTLISYGIGCSGNMANTLNVFGWHALHGRAVPAGVGAKLANNDLTVIVAGGDGDGYGEGLGHFLHAIRGNVDVTYIVHNNSIYGLTTGQASPTSERGTKAKSTPEGIIEEPINPIALALSAGSNFVARGFSGDTDGLIDLIQRAIEHPGFSVLDVFQPCVTFNKKNTYSFYNQRIYSLQNNATYDNHDRKKALEHALRADKLAVGVFYESVERSSYHDELRYLRGRALVSKAAAKRDVRKLFREFV